MALKPATAGQRADVTEPVCCRQGRGVVIRKPRISNVSSAAVDPDTDTVVDIEIKQT
jgi:hypothetical protein